jgi:hypothetical protein
MQLKKILAGVLIITISTFFSSCKKLLNPDPANIYTDARFVNDPPFAEGILLNAYISLPLNYTFDETATDDAVSNLNTSDYARMAKGEWSSQFDPMSSWSVAYKALYYTNYFLSIVNKVNWSLIHPEKNKYFNQRFRGEAHGMRAWWNFELLKRHGGKAPDGNLLGIILLDKPLDINSDWGALKRSSYDSCVQMIYDDIDSALTLLPLDYINTPDPDYTSVFTSDNKGRMSGRILKAFKSRVALHVASQSFGSTQVKWEAAADAAASSLADIGGLSGLSATGNKWYLSLADPDIIWRSPVQSINSWEQDKFPPSLCGNGRTNPSQNLVDAFPALNGFPITEASSSYDSQNPYASRDPRLTDYIVYSGNTIGSHVINTNTEDATNGINQTTLSTRTGYYLKKLLNPNVNLAPNVNSTQQHFYTLMRYTEIFLNYAEAANEAWGPDADPHGYGFTPTSIIAAIRKRGGLAQPDVYLSTITTQAAMRDLIRNERRIELCFEGFRFWDLRRWGLDLTEKAKGMQITNNVPSIIDVENRVYSPYMKFGPIPYNELLKDKQIIQNEGWK